MLRVPYDRQGEELTRQHVVQLRDAGEGTEIHGLVTKVHNQTTENTGVNLMKQIRGQCSLLSMCCRYEADLVGNFEDLGLLCGLGGLEGGFEAGQGSLVEGSGGGDGNGDFALVLSIELVEALNNALGLAQPAVLCKEREEVLGDLRGGLVDLGKESLEALLLLDLGEGGVRDEGGDLWLGLDDVGDAGELGRDLVEGGGGLAGGSTEDGLGVLCGDGGGRAAAESRGHRGRTTGSSEQHCVRRTSDAANTQNLGVDRVTAFSGFGSWQLSRQLIPALDHLNLTRLTRIRLLKMLYVHFRNVFSPRDVEGGTRSILNGLGRRCR